MDKIENTDDSIEQIEASAPAIEQLHFGQVLRQYREKAGYTVDRAAVATRISQPFIEALEEGQVQKLPAAVFGRGFIRNLCKVYNEDPKPLLMSYEMATSGGGVSIGKVRETVSPKVQQNSGLFPQIGLSRRAVFGKPFRNLNLSHNQVALFSVGLFILMIVIAWFGLRQSMGPSLGERATGGEKAAERLSGDAAAVQETLKTSGEMPANGAPLAASLVADDDYSEEAVQVEMEAKALAPDEQWVELQVKENVRVRIHRDGEGWVHEVLMPESYQYRFQNQLMLYVENVAAIDVSFNGRALGELGSSGASRLLTFKSSAANAEAL